jgi:hypothetical protein
MIRRDICLYSLPLASVVATKMNIPRDGDTLLFKDSAARAAFEKRLNEERVIQFAERLERERSA